ncbi:unnamed protein product [Linum trigynum]|uniref:ATG8-interacting protein 1 n=1 Tax=Linum trigynum TaxID=586398 RepID=A0AAV2FKP5_9ROSI
MADNEEGEGNASRGNEWEVVSLTASTYAAAPGPTEVELKDDDNDGDTNQVYKAETSHALFMSEHFVFPPSQHENLPLEPEHSEIVDDVTSKNLGSGYHAEEGNVSGGKDDGNWPLKGLNISEDFPGAQFFDTGSNQLLISGKEFEESAALPELHLLGKEESIYSTAAFNSLHSETGLGGSTVYGGIHEINESVDQTSHLPVHSSHSSEHHAKDGQHEGPKEELPCEAWWKRRALSVYGHAKEANTFWSVFVAAAVMGLVILGQRWQQERWQVLQLKWQATLSSEKSGRVLGPISRIKDVIVGGNRCHVSLMKGPSPNEH